MEITRKSVVSGKTRTMDLPITQEQYDSWKNGVLIQNAFPHLTADQREFIMTGVTQDEWDTTFAEDGSIQFTDMQVVGIIPEFLDENDPRPAREQINENYAHGGGWNTFDGFKLKKDVFTGRNFLEYPNDPPMRELSRAKLRDETLIYFEGSWLAIVQPNGEWEVARVD